MVAGWKLAVGSWRLVVDDWQLAVGRLAVGQHLNYLTYNYIAFPQQLLN